MALSRRPPDSSPTPPSERTKRRSAEELADYLGELGGALARYGCPAYRVESLVRAVAELEGHEAEAFSLPTGLFLTLATEPGAPPVQRMLRLRDWTVDLEKLLAVDEIFNDVAGERRTIEEARAALRAIDVAPAPYPAPVRWVAFAATSGAAAVFFRGGAADVWLAAVVGLAVFALGRLLGRHPQARFLHDFAGALLAALLASLGARFVPGASRDVVLLAGMIALFPGMTLTTGLAELAQKNLVSGAARLMEALVAFLALAFGIAVSLSLLGALGAEAAPAAARVGLGLPHQAAALVVVSAGFGVAFNVPRPLLWTALVSAGTSYAVTALGARHLPSHIASFAAATAVCGVANLLARSTHRPAQLYHLPGMMLLVPGSLGFLSLDDFLRGTYLSGAEKLVTTLLVSGGLVMGVLLANVLVPPKKLL